MSAFQNVILQHAQQYPESGIQDFIKLAFQAEFGPGHLAANPEKSRMMLKREMETCVENDDPLYVSIGNGLCRVSLWQWKKHGYSVEKLSELFLRTAGEKRGSMRGFLSRLEELRGVCDEIGMDEAEIDLYLARNHGRDLQPHHSERYRQRYHPSYRVVLQAALKAELRNTAG